MMKDFEAELKWFTKRLLQIRIFEVRGYGLPIPFKLADIENCPTVDFSVEMTPRDHLEEMVEEIRRFYTKNSVKSVSKDDISTSYSQDSLSVKIFGIDSDLLKSFFKIRLKVYSSLLSIKAAGALYYVETATGVVLDPTSQGVLTKLIINKDKEEDAEDKILYYDEIFEICASHQGYKEESFRLKNNNDVKKFAVARNCKRNLLGKIKGSKYFREMEDDLIIKNNAKFGYMLMV